MTDKATHLAFTVERIERPMPDTAHIFLKPERPGLAYKAGQFLTLLLHDSNGAPIRRSYSLAGAPAAGGPISICLKRKPNGSASSFLTQQLKPGDRLTALPPAGSFTLPQSSIGPYLFLAAGTGIVPVWSMIKELLLTQPEAKASLLYANSRPASILFGKEIAHWQARYAQRFKVLHLLSQPAEAKSKPGVMAGRLSNAMAEEWALAEAGPALQQAHAFLCGPTGFMLKAEMALKFIGVKAGRFHKEDFIIHTPFRPNAATLPDANATLKAKGARPFPFKVEAGQTLLEAGLKAGADLPYSCRSGSCTTCAAQLLKGEVDMYTHDTKTNSTATRGHIFTCVAYPLTPEVEFR